GTVTQVILPLLGRGRERAIPHRIGQIEEWPAVGKRQMAARWGDANRAVTIQRIVSGVCYAREAAGLTMQAANRRFAARHIGPRPDLRRAEAHAPGSITIPERRCTPAHA